MRFIAEVLAACALLLLAAGRTANLAEAAGQGGADGRPAPGLRVIVNPQNSVVSIDRKFLADAFLKRVTRWGHLETIRPVDQRPDALARRQFSDEVLRRSVPAVKTYWQQAVFSGRDIPPPELDSEEDVVRYVLRNPGAVGYVSGNVDLGGVRVLPVK